MRCDGWRGTTPCAWSVVGSQERGGRNRVVSAPPNRRARSVGRSRRAAITSSNWRDACRERWRSWTALRDGRATVFRGAGIHVFYHVAVAPASVHRPGKRAGSPLGCPRVDDAPGFTATEMLEHVPEKLRERIVSQIPVGRFGRPDEIARVVHLLASDHSSFITGAVWDVNGGQEM